MTADSMVIYFDKFEEDDGWGRECVHFHVTIADKHGPDVVEIYRGRAATGDKVKFVMDVSWT